MINYVIVSVSPLRFKIAVYLGKKHIGDIRHEQLTGGYYYLVKGGKHRGETFATVNQVKHSLEGP